MGCAVWSNGVGELRCTRVHPAVPKMMKSKRQKVYMTGNVIALCLDIAKYVWICEYR